MRIMPSPARCPFNNKAGVQCPDQLDVWGDHASSCTRQGNRHHRHNALRNHAFFLCSHAHWQCSLEERHLLLGSAQKPADLLVHDFTSGGQALAVDFTVITTTTPSRAPVQDELSAAATAKRREYEQSCTTNGIRFLPFVSNTQGRFEASSSLLLERLAQTPRLKHLYPRDTLAVIQRQLSLRVVRTVARSLVMGAAAHPVHVMQDAMEVDEMGGGVHIVDR
jgi:hypothetical protein